jgi:hypothetical protein
MGKGRLQFDSARQIGPEIPFDGALIVDTACYTGGKNAVSGIFNLEKPGPVAEEPVVLWTNGDHCSIQRIR